MTSDFRPVQEAETRVPCIADAEDPAALQISKVGPDEVYALEGRKKGGCGWRRVMCWLGVVFSIIIIALGITVLILSCTFSTKAPEVTLDKIDVVRMNVKPSGSLLDFMNLGLNMNALINITASVYNPNGYEFSVNFFDIFVKFFDMDVSNSSLPAFRLKAKGNMTQTVPFDVADVPLISIGSPNSLISNAFKEGKMQMQLVVFAQGKVRIWGISSPTYNVKMACNATVDPTGTNVFDKKCRMWQKKV